MTANSTDVFVIGGGPAGLAVAIAARQRGFSVTLADGAGPPIDKACGEGLLPDTVVALQRLGIVLQGNEGAFFSGIRFVGATASVSAPFACAPGLGVRRTFLHQRMVQRAAEVGVSLLWKTVVTEIAADSVKVNGQLLRVRWIVGADGLSSRVRRWVGLKKSAREAQRFACRQHFRVAPWSDCVEVYWGKRAQAYVTPVAENEVGVALLSSSKQLRLESLGEEFPALAQKLRNATEASTPRGAITAMRKYQRVFHKHVAMVGDASGSVDAITGEGIGLGLRQAEALADALIAGDLRLYQRAHQKLMARPFAMGRLLLLMDRHEKLRERVLRTFASEPALFAKFLAFHTGDTSPAGFTAAGVRFGWRFLLRQEQAR